MSPSYKIWLVMEKIADFIELSPKNEPLEIDFTEIIENISINEISIILQKLEKDEKVLKVLRAPRIFRNKEKQERKNTNFYNSFKVEILSEEKFFSCYDRISFKYLGSLELMGADDFLALTEVVQDIFKELGKAPTNTITIRLKNEVVSHQRLLPVVSINMLDRYCDLRFNAVKYMLNHGHITNFRLNRDIAFRWSSTITIDLNRRNFTTFFQDVMSIHPKKVINKTKTKTPPEINTKNNTPPPKSDIQPITINNNITNNPPSNIISKSKQEQNEKEGLCPTLSWDQITIKFLNGHDVRINYGDKEIDSNYTKMGFENSKKKVPNTQWKLLQHMAENDKFMKFDDVQPSICKDLKSQKSQLSKKLIEYFGINDDPIEYDESEIGKGYFPLFELLPESHRPYQNLLGRR